MALRPAAAQSVLRDAETEAFFKEISEPLIKAAKLDPANVEVILVNDTSINAFVAGGQTVYLHSGLINAADTANEVQGVIAHELGHIEGGHVTRFGEGTGPATGISIASLILAGIAIAAGAGDAGIGIMQAGQRAALGKFLAFTRAQEGVADASGARYLSAAGITGRGSISFFKKLQNFEFRLGIPQTDSYDRSHPLSGERIAILQDSYAADPAWDASLNQEWETKFKRVKAKLKGYIYDKNAALRDYPESDNSIPGHYARAYAWHKAGYPDKAAAETNALVAKDPKDPYFLELQGQIMLESGNPVQALAPLREAVRLTGNQPLIAAIFGHALIATEDPTHYDEAVSVLKAAVSRDNRNPFAWYQLGVIYNQKGDIPRASLASAEYSMMQNKPLQALQQAETAMGGLTEYSPDWIRAQDIKLVAQTEVERMRDRRR